MKNVRLSINTSFFIKQLRLGRGPWHRCVVLKYIITMHYLLIQGDSMF